MSKYIDADRLREKLNKWRDIQPTTVGLPRKATYEAMGVIQTIDYVLYLIDSLQQEQPEVNIPSAGSGAMSTIPPKFKLDVKPEQPVKGLEEEIDKRYLQNRVIGYVDGVGEILMGKEMFRRIARHFAGWGRKQILQEIYDGKVKPVDKITAAWLDDESKQKEDK